MLSIGYTSRVSESQFGAARNASSTTHPAGKASPQPEIRLRNGKIVNYKNCKTAIRQSCKWYDCRSYRGKALVCVEDAVRRSEVFVRFNSDADESVSIENFKANERNLKRCHSEQARKSSG